MFNYFRGGILILLFVLYRCCNTCEDVREAYRRKGWALSSIDDVKQVILLFTGLLYSGIADNCKIVVYNYFDHAL